MKFTKTRLALGLALLLITGLWVGGIEPDRVPAPIAPLAQHGNLGGPVLIVGGTRGTGFDIVKLMRKRGDAVTVLARPTSNTQAVEQLGAKVVRGNALNAAEVNAALASDKFVAVITTLGTTGKDRPRPDFDGNKHVFDAAKAAGVRRVLLVTTVGSGDSKGVEPWIAGRFLKEIIALKTQAEDYLRASGLDYTIIRPGGLLKSSLPAGPAFLTEDVQSFSWIGRGDLAVLVVRALDDPQAINKVYHAFDPSRTRFWQMANAGKD
jgi:nucleoside-diphosphate-sugar epimerase